MRPNVIVALLVGLGIGFAVGKAVSGGKDVTPSVGLPSKEDARTANRPAPSGKPADDTVYRVPLDEAPVLGQKDALITLVEFSDYQCPYCRRAHGTTVQLLKDYGPKLRYVLRQNPLSFHPRAMPAALAALAAGEQGKYWEMHNRLLHGAEQAAASGKTETNPEIESTLSDAALEGYARDIGLDISKWKADLQSSKLKELISKDQSVAQSLGASGTPAFFINGRKISGAVPLQNFKRVIDEELGKAEQLVKSGVPADQVYAKVLEKGVTSPPPAAPSPSAPSNTARKHIAVPSDAPFTGPKNAKVTVVVFSDFQCPYCSRAVPGMKQIAQAYPKDVKIVFRHFPLTSIHPKAEGAAEASMAAHQQGKFWAMHDKLFENQRALEPQDIEKYAKDIGLNLTKFKAALANPKLKERVQADASAAMEAGVNGTPTFFFNGRQHMGSIGLESSKALIEEEIAKANKLLASGTKPENLYEKLLAEVEAGPTIPIGSAPIKGPKNAPVTIVAYSDFQCPFCSQAETTLKSVEEKYKGKIRFVFKNDPLPFHPNARPAALAALAAHEQGHFWAYHDKLFANQQALDRGSLEKYAQELGLDMGKFKRALDSKKLDALITSDLAEAQKVGANGTPTFFINGRQLVGAQPLAAFQAVIDEELKKAPSGKGGGGH